MLSYCVSWSGPQTQRSEVEPVGEEEGREGTEEEGRQREEAKEGGREEGRRKEREEERLASVENKPRGVRSRDSGGGGWAAEVLGPETDLLLGWLVTRSAAGMAGDQAAVVCKKPSLCVLICAPYVKNYYNKRFEMNMITGRFYGI